MSYCTGGFDSLKLAMNSTTKAAVPTPSCGHDNDEFQQKRQRELLAATTVARDNGDAHSGRGIVTVGQPQFKVGGSK